jgi:polyisoprenyl-phosphate glycosyltransferase
MEYRIRTIAIVAPFHNEEKNVQMFYERLRTQMDTLPIDYRFVFVDDGSRDDTLKLLNDLADFDNRITVLSLARNFGHQAAITAGLDYADADAIVVMDSDLQHPPETIIEMVREFERGVDVVYGVREDNQQVSWHKRFLSKTFYRFLNRTSSVHVIPGASDFRMMSRRSMIALHQMRETHRYLRGMVPWLGFPYAIVRYQQAQRHAGTPSYTLLRSLDLARHGFFSFSTVPLELISWLGMLLTFGAGVYLLYVLAIAVFGRPVSGWTSLIAVLLVLGGVQLLSIGVIAQYIGMIFTQVKERPLYILKQERLATPLKEVKDAHPVSPIGS